MRLSADTARRLAPSVKQLGYDRCAPGNSIVHFGIGAFHRAHQAVYTDDGNRSGNGEIWSITGVSLRSPGVANQLNPQDGLFTVTERSKNEPLTRLVGSVGRVLFGPEQFEEVIRVLADAKTSVATLTVTEKGYYARKDTLDRSARAVADDFEGNSASSIYGFLETGLRRRREAGLAGLTLLSCDNLAENGRKLRSLLLEYLGERDDDLAQWCEQNCHFPSSMVDRIVPATTDDDLDWVADRIGLRDEAAVITEPFRQWVIEDTFASARPQWEAGGAEIVSDVRPYETAKLRMLNGAHSALAYLGLAAGYEFVSEAIADPQIRPLVERLMREEAAPSFAPAQEQDLERYAADLMERFSNPALEHRLVQIAMDGSQKIAQRWLATLAAHGERDADCTAILSALAAWIVHVRPGKRQIDDPMSELLANLWAAHGQDGIVAALFAEEGMFGNDWRPSAAATRQLENAIKKVGVPA